MIGEDISWHQRLLWKLLKMIKLIEDLWYSQRNLVSDDYEKALQYISKIIPLKIHNVESGTKCWTWTIPEKWTANEAWIEDLEANRLLDFKDHPLHLISYSLPINKVVSKNELMEHLHTNQKRPDAIPFEFKYYQKDWGFCIQHNKLKNFTKEKYKVCIDSKFENGSLKIGDFTIKGESDETIVLVAHLCHPSMVNDDLAGVSVLVDVAKEMNKRNNHYTYKCLFLPETIGSVAYLSQNEDLIPNFKYGIFFEMLGNANIHALQLSKQGNTRLDRIARYILQNESNPFKEGGFRQIICNDEMVFNGPGVNIPMISISRYPYPEYHTSDDNPNIVSEERLNNSKETILKILEMLDLDYTPKRKFKGPIFLSGYGLWVDWRINEELNLNLEKIMLRLEGDKSIFEIAQELGMKFSNVKEFVDKLLEKDLIEKI
jgi:aminopeptidase-like protein